MDASTVRQVLELHDDPVAVERPAHQNLRDEVCRASSAGAVLPDAYGDGEIPSLIDHDEWRTVLVALEQHGYVYAPQDFLLTDYDGVNAPLIACYGESGWRLTWWTRFFDWI